MASFNRVILMGNLTANPELKQTQGGTPVTSFNLAVDRRYNKGEEKKCDFITIVAWRNTAEFICRNFAKGQAILVCGELQTRSWEDQQGNKRLATEAVATEAYFCEAKRDSETNNTTANKNGSQGKFEPSAYIPEAYTQTNFEQVDTDDSLPF